MTSKPKSAAQVPFARKAAKLKAERRKSAPPSKLIAANQAHIIEAGLAANNAQHQSDREHAHGARAPPVRLMSKAEVCAITGMSFPTIWAWMRCNRFPRSRSTGGSNSKSMWLSYAIDFPDLYRRSAEYVDRILKGEKPADLPVQAPTKFKLTINLKAAKAIGVTVPQSLMATADEVIE